MLFPCIRCAVSLYSNFASILTCCPLWSHFDGLPLHSPMNFIYSHWLGSKSRGDGVTVTWDRPDELEAYIEKVQSAANRLTSENRRLRKCHMTVAEKVSTTFFISETIPWTSSILPVRDTDGLCNPTGCPNDGHWSAPPSAEMEGHFDGHSSNHGQPGPTGEVSSWSAIFYSRSCWVIIQNCMVPCIAQGFSSENMRPWKAHWDRQLYKALEHQYQMGLEALNENLPEIRVELTYRWEVTSKSLSPCSCLHLCFCQNYIISFEERAFLHSRSIWSVKETATWAWKYILRGF